MLHPDPANPTAFDPLELYAAGIDTSDYVARVAPIIARHVPVIGSLLDIGAGGGQLGAALQGSGQVWTAIEPSPTMLRRLERRPEAPHCLPVGWAEAQPERHETVLAANMLGPLTAARTFLAACRAWASRTIIWVVPAQDGPRGLCLAGCLPAEWHGEDETPGVDIVLRQLAGEEPPEIAGRADWSFVLDVPSIPAIAAYLADRLGWPADDRRRPQLREHLVAQARPVEGGFRLTVPRASAVLIWRVSARS